MSGIDWRIPQQLEPRVVLGERQSIANTVTDEIDSIDYFRKLLGEHHLRHVDVRRIAVYACCRKSDIATNVKPAATSRAARGLIRNSA